MIFRDRNLNIAILASVAWHLVFMLLVTPLLVSGNTKKNATNISFLGSILENVVAIPEKPMELDKSSFMEKIERIKDMVLGELNLGQPEAISKSNAAGSDKEEFVSSAKKDNPPIFKLWRKKSRGRQAIEFEDVLIAGEARNRMVLYKPGLPKFSIMLSDFESGYNVVVGFRISGHGFVENPECIVSSGSSEIDELSLRYIRRWQFVPHDDTQQAVVRLNFSNR